MAIKKYIKVWYLTTAAATQTAFASRFGAIIFIVGKIARFAFFLVFLILISSRTRAIASYSLWQIIFFYATFNLGYIVVTGRDMITISESSDCLLKPIE